jgi:hypothetical protein
MRIKTAMKSDRIQATIMRIALENAVRKTGASNPVKGLPASASWDGFAAGKGPAERGIHLSGIKVIGRKFPKKFSCCHARQRRRKRINDGFTWYRETGSDSKYPEAYISPDVF